MSDPTQITKIISNLAYAQSYARKYGWPVFPIHEALPDGRCTCGMISCKNQGKHPRTRNGLKNASTDPEQINQWWRTFPNAPIAILCGGQHGPIVIDVDVPEGEPTWAALVQKYGIQITITAKTGGGGEHFYFARHQLPVQSKMGGLGLGVDLCADGHYVIAPPSIHASGERYAFRPGMGPVDGMPLAPCPDWVLEVSSQKHRSAASSSKKPGRSTTHSHVEASEKGWLATAFEAVGWLGEWHATAGAWMARCPWAHEHSDERGDGKDSSTIVYPPMNGRTLGFWKCEHGHCGGRTLEDVRKALPPNAVSAANKAYPPRRQMPPRPAEPQSADTTQPDQSQQPQQPQQPSPSQSVPPAPIDPTTGEVLNEGDWTEELKRDQKTGYWSSCVANASLIVANDLRWKDVLAYNAFTYQYVYLRSPPWEKDSFTGEERSEIKDSDGLRLSVWLHRKWGIKIGLDVALSVLQGQCERKAFNPLKEWLLSLEWDKKPRIPTWTIEYLSCEDTPYHRAAGFRWIISAVARVMEPGCRADLVLIMEGEQGTKKSTGIANLASDKYFADNLGDLTNKDSSDALRGKWILEIGEMISTMRANNDVWKAYASRRIDHYRPAYARTAIDVPRSCVFCGTTNTELYISDETGARRNLAIKCGKVKADDIKKDRDQLWAEAVHYYKQGEIHWLTEKEEPLQIAEQEHRRELDAWHGLISDWLDNHSATNLITIPMLMRDAVKLEPDKWDLKGSRRIGKILRILNWRRDKLVRNSFAPHRADYVYLPPSFVVTNSARGVEGEK